jgi:PKD repeat protein
MPPSVSSRVWPLALVVLLVVSVGAAKAQAATANPRGRMLGTVLAVTPATATARRADARQAAAAGDSSNDLAYHGGPVMHTDHTYSIYWEPPGHTSSAGYKDGIDRYLTDVAADSGKTTNVYATQSLYWDAAGTIAYDSTFAGRIVDTNPYPAGGCQGPSGGACLSDAQLQTELQRLATAGGLPTGDGVMYLIFTPPGVDTCDGGYCAFSEFCGYHSWIGSGAGMLIYSDQPYLAGTDGCDLTDRPNGNDADPTVNVVSHEQNEAVTDPAGTGWYDASGSEIGDKCAWNFGTPVGSTAGGAFNQVIAGHDYWLQQEWSNAGSTCVQTNAADEPPTVAMSSSPYSPVPGQPVSFTATGADPDGTIASYAWDFGDGQTASGAQVSHTFAAFGTYTVTVTATDSDGQTATDTQSVYLLDQPVAVITAAPVSPVVGTTLALDGSGSSSPGGPITAYAWTFIESDSTYSTATGASATHVVAHPGELEVELTVTDAAGATGSTWTYVTVRPRPPTARITSSTTRQFANLSIDFDGTSSTGPDESIASYAWQFGDGASSTSSSPAHTYAAAGVYPVTLTVTDTQGQTAQITQTVTIVDRPPIPSIVYLPRAPTAGSATEFDGGGTYAPDAIVASYVWSFGDGQVAVGVGPDHTFALPGTYTVSLTATDASGATGTTTDQIVVGPAPAVPTPVPTVPTVTPTPTPTATPTPTPVALTPTPAPTAASSAARAPLGSVAVARTQRITGLTKSGLRFSVTCASGCRIAYAFLMPAAAGHPEVLLAGGKAALAAPGTRRFTVRLARSALRRLAGHHVPTLVVELTGPASGAVARWLDAAIRVG